MTSFRAIAWLLPEPPASAARTTAGHRTVGLDEVPGEPWDLSEENLIAVGVVADDRTAARALDAADRGTALAVHVAVPPALRHRFLEDLHKVADVRVGIPMLDAEGNDPVAALLGVTGDRARLLDALATGDTVTGAALRLHLSRRTASRWLAELRAASGTTSTAELVRDWTRVRPRPR